MSFRQTLMSFVSPRQGKRLRDRDLELRRFHRSIEALEFAHAGNRIIGDEFDATSLLRLGLGPIRISETAVASQYVKCTLKGITTRQREYCVDAVGREPAGRLCNTPILAIQCHARAHLAPPLSA